MDAVKTKEISVRYFALFREQRGLSSETIQTAAGTLGDLYAELSGRHNFTLPLQRVRVAVNDEFVQWEDALQDRTSVVFIPPVAGG